MDAYYLIIVNSFTRLVFSTLNFLLAIGFSITDMIEIEIEKVQLLILLKIQVELEKDNQCDTKQVAQEKSEREAGRPRRMLVKGESKQGAEVE